jgi:hypothetical protein
LIRGPFLDPSQEEIAEADLQFYRADPICTETRRAVRAHRPSGHRDGTPGTVEGDPRGRHRRRAFSSVFLAPDGAFYVYAYSRVLSNLYLVEEVR